MRTMTMLMILALAPHGSVAQVGNLRSELAGLASRIARATDELERRTSRSDGRPEKRLDAAARRSVLPRLEDRADELSDAARSLRGTARRGAPGVSRTRHGRVARFNRALAAVERLLGDAEHELRRRGDRRLHELFERDVREPWQRMEALAPRLSVARPRDTVLARDIHAAFAGDRWLKGDRIGVRVRDGVAELTGAVDSAYERVRAERRARAVRGVVRVRNRLIVRTARTQGVV